MEDFLPAIGFILYILFQVFAASRGKKKKKGPQGEQQKSSKSLMEMLQEQMQKAEQQLNEALPDLKEITHQSPEEEEEPYLNPIDEYTPLSEQVELHEYEPISAEILNAPYSNLEEGILDDTHRSKFAHHQKSEQSTKSKAQPNDLFDKVSPKEAFVYSLIFKRKYFDVIEPRH